jgi:hypothetical protein
MFFFKMLIVFHQRLLVWLKLNKSINKIKNYILQKELKNRERERYRAKYY